MESSRIWDYQLSADIRPAVPEILYFDQVDSTNRAAEQWEDAPDFALVVADHQTAGRGRLTRTWYDEPGRSLLFSLVLRPQVPPAQFGMIGLAGGLCMAQAIEEVSAGGLRPALKWPNDIRVGGRKAGGILASSREQGEGFRVVMGIGVNVTTQDFPAEFAGEATSLAAEGVSTTRENLLEAFLQRFHDVWTVFPGSVPRAYADFCDTIGRRVSVALGNEIIEGTATGIDELGRLVMDGKRPISSGEVVKIRENEGR
ncbi:MAG: biotin--[acetyl-CoA-carboxylase] ligase [Actinomycetota bacterium]